MKPWNISPAEWDRMCPPGYPEDDRPELIEQLKEAKRIQRNAVRRMHRIYYGAHPCAERQKNLLYDAAYKVVEELTKDCNKIIDQINEERRQREARR